MAAVVGRIAGVSGRRPLHHEFRWEAAALEARVWRSVVVGSSHRLPAEAVRQVW
ncbi:MAG TPA: hypothetical protein VFY07_00705 [Geomobilimonas sp.]|nr:hypothetical protein [Geomobilimonas sp.]